MLSTEKKRTHLDLFLFYVYVFLYVYLSLFKPRAWFLSVLIMHSHAITQTANAAYREPCTWVISLTFLWLSFAILNITWKEIVIVVLLS